MSSRRKKDVLYLKILNTVISKNGKGDLMIIETNSEKETWDLGFSLGEKACAGQVYTLVGDLGVGKTIFTKGLAKGLGIDEPVSSPTFTIVQIYDEEDFPFIILMCTESVMWKRWMRLAMKITFTERASA
mgnify:CR=1 FL=1